MSKSCYSLVALLALQFTSILSAQTAPTDLPSEEPKVQTQPSANKDSASAENQRGTERTPRRQSRRRADIGKRSPAFLGGFAEVVEGSSKATVRVLVDGNSAALGTVVSKQGHILTKASEVDGGEKELTCRLHDGSVHPAKLMATDEEFDVGLLKIEAEGLNVPEWKDAANLPAGTFAAAPAPGKDAIAFGVISVPLRNFSVSSRGYLGVRVGEAEGGVLIETVEPETAASKSGLEAKDVIQSVDEKKVSSPNALIGFLRACKPKQRITLELLRDGEVSTKEVVLGRYVRASGRTPRLTRKDRLGGPLSEDGWGYPSALQHDLVLAPDQCGGPLVTLDGKVIGINIARSSRIRSFAIPSEMVVELMTELGVPDSSEKLEAAEKNLKDLSAKYEAAKKAVREAEQDLREAEEKLKSVQQGN